eukprot:TRINITY_DN3747_c3_g1_i1.p1 TRINITY_DN3747_c3_g1~~TRINITY_DN3747_c3_g1_i1.p1  ORF type:complete len:104 (-),score=32.76 TRINITY_DN3747_c3_g1_i1:78-389(-)
MQNFNFTHDPETQQFIEELEFVQSLSNPLYLNYLAEEGYFDKIEFLNYLDYLLYWKQPQYAKYLIYPFCLQILELLQKKEFQEFVKQPRNVDSIIEFIARIRI